jgi:hypothetical protein
LKEKKIYWLTVLKTLGILHVLSTTGFRCSNNATKKYPAHFIPLLASVPVYSFIPWGKQGDY